MIGWHGGDLGESQREEGGGGGEEEGEGNGGEGTWVSLNNYSFGSIITTIEA